MRIVRILQINADRLRKNAEECTTMRPPAKAKGEPGSARHSSSSFIPTFAIAPTKSSAPVPAELSPLDPLSLNRNLPRRRPKQRCLIHCLNLASHGLYTEAEDTHIPPIVASIAITVFTNSHAEMHTHGAADLDSVHFHEVGAVDSIGYSWDLVGLASSGCRLGR